MRRATAGMWCLALALAGCHRPVTQPAYPATPPTVLPVVGRTPVEPDVSAVPTDPAAPLTRPGEYRRLTAAECRTLAVANAPFADNLDRHPENDSPPHPRFHKKATRFADTSRLVRGHAADELRNRAAGDALGEFFQLANAEGQFDLLTAASTELRTQLESALKAEASGLKDRADIPGIRRQLLDLEARQAKLEAAIGALNAGLRARLGVAACDPLPLWPADPLAINPNAVDVNQAVATGLHFRPDLNLLRALTDGSAGEMTDAILTGVNPLLGKLSTDNPLVALFAPLLALTKEPQRQRAAANARVADVLAARERQAEAEIRAAAALLRGNRAAVAARALDVKQVEARIADLRKRQKAGLNEAAELVAAELDLLKAKGDLLTAVTDWHAAEVKLRQAMGLLVRE